MVLVVTALVKAGVGAGAEAGAEEKVEAEPGVEIVTGKWAICLGNGR